MKSKHSVHILFEVVTSSLCPFNFPHGLHQVLGRGNACQDREGGYRKTLYLVTRLNAKKRAQSYMSEKLCDNITPNIWLPNFSDGSPLYCYVWLLLGEKPTSIMN